MTWTKLLAVALVLVLGMATPVWAQITVPHVFSTSVPVSQLNTDLSTLGTGALNRTGGTITGNITVNSGVTIDGVDISAVLAGTGTPTFSTVTISGSGASALDVAGGINAGSGNVGIVDSTGKIPAISSTYFASLSGANLTGLSFSQLSTTWASRAYSSGNYTANGSMTWTVDSGDVGTDLYVAFGKTLFWSTYIVNSTVGGTASSELRISLPGGSTVASGQNVYGTCSGFNNAAVAEVAWAATSGASYVTLYKTFGSNWALATNDTSVSCMFVIPIN